MKVKDLLFSINTESIITIRTSDSLYECTTLNHDNIPYTVMNAYVLVITPTSKHNILIDVVYEESI